MTVVDDGTLPDRRGSLTVDDEGTPTSRTVLIEDGILVGFLQDRLNARLMGMRADRQRPAPVLRPRADAAHDQHRHAGRHAHPGGDDPLGEARPVRGEFRRRPGGHHLRQIRVLGVSEAYLIEDGKVTAPVKGATLIGNGPDALTKVTMVGNDMALDPGIGTCGKNGQGVPVGVGQPTLKLAGLTVGGTAA